MKVPLSWLREFADVDLPVDELVEVMGRNGLEVEEVRRPGVRVNGVIVARVLDVAEHPNADRIKVVTVDDGDGERTVCAGAWNMQPGDLVPLAVPGATLPTDDDVFEIGRRDMRGITSDGMLCSPKELEVADDHSGILVLGAGGWDVDAEPGTDLHDVLALGDPVIDVAVPADRGDLHSVFGVARDLAAILDVAVRPPSVHRALPDGDGDGPVPIRISASDGCARYVGWSVENLRIGPSPWWLRQRLESCGVRSLSNLVDITNYVMLELGQPLHAFDLATLHGPEIGVRWAQEGERLTTLDGKPRELSGDDLVITDADRVVALAGVMGGADTEVGDATERVLIEAAVFDSQAVRRTSRRLGLLSEASLRFERRVDPEGADRAAARAVDLLVDLAGGSDAGARGDGPGLEAHTEVTLDPSWTGRFLGTGEIPVERQAKLLERAGIDVVDAKEDRLVARAPSWRGDLERPADLVEEIARLHGYERIPATLPQVALRGGLTARQRAEREVRRGILAAGFHEAQTTSFVAPGAIRLLAAREDDAVRLRNPLAQDADTMRPSLAEGLLAAARRNVGQGRPGLALFEIGRIFRARGSALDTAPGAERWTWEGPDGQPLPDQPVALGLVAYGPRMGETWLDREDRWGVYDLLAVADEVAQRAGVASQLERVASGHPALHPGRTGALHLDGQAIGLVGQLHPDEAEVRDLPGGTVIGELLLDPLWGHLDDARGEPAQAPRLPRHPALNLDVAVIADEDLAYAEVEAAVRDGAGDVLDGLWWFDEYRGEQVGTGARSLAFHLRLQAPDRQLTDDDAESALDRIAAAVQDVGARLRR